MISTKLVGQMKWILSILGLCDLLAILFLWTHVIGVIVAITYLLVVHNFIMMAMLRGVAHDQEDFENHVYLDDYRKSDQ